MFRSLQWLTILFLLFISPAFSAIEKNPPHNPPPQLLQSEQFSTTDVRFQSRGKEYVTYFTSGGLIVAGFTSTEDGPQYFELGMQLMGSQHDVEITTLNPMLASNDQWVTNLPDFARIKYANVYPGIDMICFGNENQLQMQFMIAAGGNVNRIRLRLTGSNEVETTPEGGLRLIARNKAIEMPRPVGYQIDATGEQRSIEARYVVNADHEISLRLGAFDPKRPLILNP